MTSYHHSDIAPDSDAGPQKACSINIREVSMCVCVCGKQGSWLQVILPQQQLFESSEHWTAALAHIPDPDVRDKLGRAWSNNGKGRPSDNSDDLNVARWNELVHELASMSRVWLLGLADQDA